VKWVLGFGFWVVGFFWGVGIEFIIKRKVGSGKWPVGTEVSGVKLLLYGVK
jgi:hypothetical protein